MSRSWKWPVTPEVAGSSPVAPVKSLQIGIFCCRIRQRMSADYTNGCSSRVETAQSGAKPGSTSRFQAVFGLVDNDRRPAFDYTERPEVTHERAGLR
jgi:hypothetical protein